MRRGTRVGQAYIAVTADGDGINEEIVDSVESAGPGVEKAGEEHGEKYGDGFSEGFFARMKRKFGPQLETELNDRMDRSGDEAGDHLGSSLIDGLRARLTQEHSRIDDLIERILGDNGRSDKRMSRLTVALGASERMAGRLNTELLQTLRLEQKIAAAAARTVSGNGKDKDPFGDTIGRFFGAGSRNNALNLFGKSIGNIVNLSESMFRSLSRFPSLLRQFSAGVETAAEGAGLFEKIGAGFGKNGIAISETLSAVAASGPGAAIALVAVSVAMTLLVSVANALLAVLTALVATVASALVGSLLVAGAGFTALAGAAGLGVLAFMSMTDAQKQLLSEAFRPLHEEAIGLGQTMLNDLIPSFDTWSRNLQVALALAKPLADIMGGALAQAGNILTASFAGPGFQLFIATLASTINGASLLEGIITHLSSALGGFLNGMLGLFAAVLPFVLQFSVYLDRVATRFSQWAASAQGQNAISDFVQRALVSLQSLWNFVSALGGLLTAVLFSNEGQRAGNNIFDDMANAVRRFTDYITKDNRLQHWFDQGVTFATALGDAILTVGQILESLNQSGVIDGIAWLARSIGAAYEIFQKMPRVVQDLINPLQGVSDVVGYFAGAVERLMGTLSSAPSIISQVADAINGIRSSNALDTLLGTGVPDVGASVPALPDLPGLDELIAQLQGAGSTALAGTNIPAVTVDPNDLTAAQMAAYQAMADAIIKEGPTFAALIAHALHSTHKTIQNAIRSANKDFADSLRDATTAGDAASVTSALQSLVESQSATIQNTIQTLKANAANMVSTAQDAVNSAAEALKSATTKSQAKEALAALAIAQDQLAQAEAAQVKINNRTKKLRAALAAANSIVSAQGVLTQANADALAHGFLVVNATLADYADARAQVAVRLEAANQKLQEAIALRDNFRSAITDAVNSFAALTTAQAQTLNGVQQALTANDITSNLQTKLDQIKKFQSNLQILLSQGLSMAAYKQLLDAGVEQGGAFAQALVNGGQGSVQQVNSLVSQISGVADQLGLEASNRMYQAGVDAAQGLVDGLTSLSAQLNSAATQLGTAIAAAIATALGIHSPSTVMFDYMDYGVGDGLVNGLDAQHKRVGEAATRLSEKIAVSPEVAAYAGTRGDDGYGGPGGVSGNKDPRFRDLVINTPTKDPLAVAHEALNEIVGRI